MTPLRHAYLAALTLTLAMNSACDARDNKSAGQTSNYQTPVGWVSECVGRFVADMPQPINFGTGAAYDEEPPWFESYASRELRTGGRDSGRFELADVALSETARLTEDGATERLIRAFRRGLEVDRRQAEKAMQAAYVEVPLTVSKTGFGSTEVTGFHLAFVEPADGRARVFKREKGSGMASEFDEQAAQKNIAQARLFAKDFLPRYTPRTPGTLPTTPGICTPYGFFADPSKSTERDYVFDMRFRDPKHSNLILGISIKTRNEQTTGTSIEAKNIRDEVTPWDYERAHARKQKKDCRSQQGTASRDIFGCAFAGMTNIQKHRDVEYIKLANGQEARVLVMEYAAALNEYTAYDVLIETAGVENSATEPRIVISARGIDAETQEPALRGKKPPPIDEAVQLARSLALSLRLRPGAVDPARPVVDSLAAVR